ncbi:MAG: tetratricopeptide repeat protein [Yoonia sp.]|uniref:tetratricopeptide repeat protein n=1 Tax=Yoonia sp. TaxID=2212373 RepID=UPI003EF18F80
MVRQALGIKCIVTALLLLVGGVSTVQAQGATLETLYQELEAAGPDDYKRIEQQIFTAWGKSGSAAMDLLMRRGKDALDEGAPEEAVEQFTALLDHAPDVAEGYYGRASSYYLLGRTGPALADIQRTLELEPRHFEAMRGLAIIMEELERPADAKELYDMILEINPQSVETQEAAARLELQLEGQSL